MAFKINDWLSGGSKKTLEPLEEIQEKSRFGVNQRIFLFIWGSELRGGGSITVQMAAYGGRDDGLFRGAIIESGVQFNPLYSGTSQAANDDFQKVVVSAGCAAATDKLQCLRSSSYDSLYAAFQPVLRIPYLNPVIDGKLIPQDLVQAYKLGRFVKVPVIIGDNTDEGSGIASVPFLRFDFDFQIRNFIQGTQSLVHVHMYADHQHWFLTLQKGI